MPLCAQNVEGKLSIIRYWETCPDFISEQKEIVLEALDKEAKQKLPLELYGGFTLLKVNNDELTIRTSSLSTWTLRTLKTSEGKEILAVIRTVESPIADSQLDFYTSSWIPLKRSEYFSSPKGEHFFNDRKDFEMLDKYLSPLYTTYTFTSSHQLEIKLSHPDWLNDEKKEELNQAFDRSTPLYFEWQGKSFKKVRYYINNEAYNTSSKL